MNISKTRLKKAPRDVEGELIAYTARIESGEKPRLRKTTMERKPNGTIERKVYDASGKLESQQTLPAMPTKKAKSTKEKIEITESCGNVFADLEFPPDEAANLLLRSNLMIRLKKVMQDSALTKAQAAKRFSVTPRQITLLLKGKIQEFSIDELVNMLARAGYEIEPNFVALRRVSSTEAMTLTTPPMRPIRTKRDYEAALARVDTLWDAPAKSAEADALDVLTLLIADFESKHFPMPSPDPIDFLNHVMESRGLARKDLEPFIGSRGRVSEILSRTRPLSLTMIRNLTTGLRLPADVLVKPYALAA